MATVTVLHDNVVECQYTEPTTTIRVSDGALIPLDDLVATRIYYQIAGQAPVMAQVVPATASAGGGSITRQLTIPVVGTQSVDFWFTAVDEVPNESPASQTFTLALTQQVIGMLLDDFNRADTGPPPGSGWSLVPGIPGLKVVSNTCRTSDPTSYTYSVWNTVYAADQEFSITLVNALPVAGKSWGIDFRVQNPASLASDMYQISFAPDASPALHWTRLKKQVGGVWTQVGNTVFLPAPLALGNVLGVRAVGPLIEALINDSVVASWTDASVSGSGGVGISGDININADAAVDDFRGGALGDTTPPTAPAQMILVSQTWTP